MKEQLLKIEVSKNEVKISYGINNHHKSLMLYSWGTDDLNDFDEFLYWPVSQSINANLTEPVSNEIEKIKKLSVVDLEEFVKDIYEEIMANRDKYIRGDVFKSDILKNVLLHTNEDKYVMPPIYLKAAKLEMVA